MAFELMNTQEIHEFGLQVLLQHLTEKGFEIEFAQPNKSEIPHVVAKQGEQLIFILVATDVYPNKGTIADSEKQALLEHAQTFAAQSACAYLGIVNADGVVNKDKDYVPKLLKMHNFILTSADLNSFISKIEVLRRWTY